MTTKDKAADQRNTKREAKAHTASGCVRLGLHQYTGNLKKTITGSWPFALVSAVCTAGIPCLLFGLTKELYAPSHLLGTGIAAIVLALLAILSELYVYAGCLRLAAGETVPVGLWKCPRLFLRVCRLALYLSVLQLLPIAIAVGGHLLFHKSAPADHASTLSVALMLTVAIIVIIEMLYLPVTYIAMKFLLEKKSNFFHLLFKHYLPSMRYYGLMFAVVLLTFIFVSLVCALVAFPCHVLALACGQAAQGYAIGDAVTLPGYFTALMMVVGTFIFWLAIYVKSSAINIATKLYEAVDTRRLEQVEKQELLNDTKTR